jgi:hypothetical protein
MNFVVVKPYVPEAYIGRGGLDARGLARNPGDVLAEKAEFLDAREEVVEEQGKKNIKAISGKQFKESWTILFNENDFAVRGQEKYNQAAQRLPDMDSLHMPTLVIACAIRARLMNEIRRNRSLEDINADFLRAAGIVDGKISKDPDIGRFWSLFIDYFLKLEVKFKIKGRAVEKYNPDKQIIDVYRYICKLNAFDVLWVQERRNNE